MNYVLIGKIVNTHGIKGELRIVSDFKFKDRVFTNDFKLYIDKNKYEENINSYRKHKNYDMVTFKNYNNINQVLKYKGKLVYVNREDLKLKIDEYLNEDLIGMDIIINNEKKGFVRKISKYPSNYMLNVNYNEKEYLIPLVDGIIETINLEKKEIVVKNIKGLIE